MEKIPYFRDEKLILIFYICANIKRALSTMMQVGFPAWNTWKYRSRNNSCRLKLNPGISDSQCMPVAIYEFTF